jgi:hypothetical protein
MRTTLVVMFLALAMSPDVMFGQSTEEAANNHHLDYVFGTVAEPDLEAVAASYFERLDSPGSRIALTDQREWRGARVFGRANAWASQSDQPAPANDGGSRFGGPLLWTMVIIAATTVGFVYMGIRLSPAKPVPLSEE